jgi:hypothetical protein
MPNPAPAATVSDVVGTKPTIDLERGNRSLLHGRIVRQANNYNSTKRRRFDIKPAPRDSCFPQKSPPVIDRTAAAPILQ